MTEATRGALREARRVALGPLVTLAVYLVALRAFEAVTEDDGLLTPGGAPELGVTALGLLVLFLRLAVAFALPTVLSYRMASRALDWLAARQRRASAKGAS